MLRRARLADMASQLDDWANSPGLQPMHTNSRGYKAGPQKEDREAVMAQRRQMARYVRVVRMKLKRPTWSVALRARYAELLRLRAFVKRIEDSYRRRRHQA